MIKNLEINKTLSELLPFKTRLDDLIRLGSKHDGGYVLSKTALNAADVLYTYGVSTDYTFEEDYISLSPDKIVRMFDHTVSMSSNPRPNIYFMQQPLSINETDTENSFIQHLEHYSDKNKNIFFKVDVEGYEYEYLLNLSKNIDILKKITGMVIEFHFLNEIEYFEKFKQVIVKLQKYFCVNHVHGNNCGDRFMLNGSLCPVTIELSFCNLKLASDFKCRSVVYPLLDLDSPNHHERLDYQIFISK